MCVGIGGRGSRELLERWNNECSMRMVLLGRFKAVPPILIGKLLVFTVTVRLATVCLFFFNLMELWNEYWSRTSWNATGFAISFPRLSHFSWLNASQIVVRFWLISRVLKKLILTIFTCVIAFIKEQILRYLYPAFLLMFFSWCLEQTILILMCPTL